MELPYATKTIILAKALNLFSRKGYDAVGIQEIVEEAKITKPTLYYYFGSKQGLLEAIISFWGNRYSSLLHNAAAYQHDLVMNLTKLLQETVWFARDEPEYFRLQSSLFSSAPETPGYIAAEALKREIRAAVEKLFTEASKDHGNMQGREKMYGITFLSLIETCAHLVLNNELEMDTHMEYRIIHQFMHGIFS
ncbi:MAG: TetR/AcrR family transcriptional regulator [Spirochaetaceae bacterium]|jgi:TetR/AcrR family transcriptional regulator|nr:TetR/AcrR family transcriptional regulator [Spirochaetaceae bacterium]